MKKTVEIDLGCDRLLSLAEKMLDEHDYIGALKMLNKNAEINGDAADSFMLYAETFDDMQLYEKCINGWFKFLDCATDENAPPEDFAEAYEGLALSYSALGEEKFSAYYYNKLLLTTGELDDNVRQEIIDCFLGEEPTPLKVVYPPREADCTDIMADGLELMKSGEYTRAAEEFEKVEEGNERYIAARNYIAMCRIIEDKTDEAERECLNLLEKYPGNVQALTTLAAVKTEQGDKQASRALAEKLISLEASEPDDMYKIATVCCENGMHGEAYKLFVKLEEEMPYDGTLIFFKAVAAFNCGKRAESAETFIKLLTIYPDAVTARAVYDYSLTLPQGEALSYFYRLPEEDRQKTLILLASVSSRNRLKLHEIEDMPSLEDCVRWCFDEVDGRNNPELQLLAVDCAIKAGLDGIVRELLLNAFLPDNFKVETLAYLAMRNLDDNFGVVVCHNYRSIDLYKITLQRKARKAFLRAYANLTARFSPINNTFGARFAVSAEVLQADMCAGGRADLASDGETLAATVFYLSRVEVEGYTDENIPEKFKTTAEKIRLFAGDLYETV